MKRKGTDSGLLYTLEGNPGFWRALPYSVQQILAMFVTNLVPIGIVAAALSAVLRKFGGTSSLFVSIAASLLILFIKSCEEVIMYESSGYDGRRLS